MEYEKILLIQIEQSGIDMLSIGVRYLDGREHLSAVLEELFAELDSCTGSALGAFSLPSPLFSLFA